MSIIDTATSKPVLISLPPAYHCTFRSADTSTIDLIKQLDTLLYGENTDGYIFQASSHAYENAKLYLEVTRGLMGRLFPEPEFVSDGEGGIDIEWANGARKVTLSCRGHNAQKDYIYWQENNEYGARDISLSRLIERLRWLTHA